MGRYLEKARQQLPFSQEDNALNTKTINNLDNPERDTAKEANLAKEVSDLQDRLTRHGIHICLDRATGQACVVFSQDLENVRSVSTVIHPVALTPMQRREIEDSLEYFENLLERRQS